MGKWKFFQIFFLYRIIGRMKCDDIKSVDHKKVIKIEIFGDMET